MATRGGRDLLSQCIFGYLRKSHSGEKSHGVRGTDLHPVGLGAHGSYQLGRARPRKSIGASLTRRREGREAHNVTLPRLSSL